MRDDAVILVGHGAVPRDCPRELVTRLMALEGRRRASRDPPGAEEQEIDARIRAWPRTPATDPYQAGIEALAAALRPRLGGAILVVAYNEFCAPTLADAALRLIHGGRRRIAVVPSMLTPGGVHSEVEIPEAIAHLQARHPDVSLRYAWPFDLGAVAGLLAEQVAGWRERG